MVCFTSGISCTSQRGCTLHSSKEIDKIPMDACSPPYDTRDMRLFTHSYKSLFSNKICWWMRQQRGRHKLGLPREVSGIVAALIGWRKFFEGCYTSVPVQVRKNPLGNHIRKWPISTTSILTFHTARDLQCLLGFGVL